MYIPKPKAPPPEGQELPQIPTHGKGRIWYVLSTHFGKLVWSSMLFLLFSIPIVTIPAATAGLCAVIRSLYRSGQCMVWPTFWEEFRTDTLARTVYALLLFLLPIVGWMIGNAISSVAIYITTALPLVLVLLVTGYWFPQLATLRLSSGQCLKNAFLLACIETKSNFFLLLIQGGFTALFLLLWPFGIPLLLLLPALSQLLIAAVVYPILDQRLSQKEEETVSSSAS